MAMVIIDSIVHIAVFKPINQKNHYLCHNEIEQFTLFLPFETLKDVLAIACEIVQNSGGGHGPFSDQSFAIIFFLSQW